jgi:hypothetical protein
MCPMTIGRVVVFAALIGCGGAPPAAESTPVAETQPTAAQGATTAEQSATAADAQPAAFGATVHCLEPELFKCTQYATEEIDVSGVQGACAAVGVFADGECPVEDRVGYCDDEFARVYAYRGANVTLFARIECHELEWVDL